jgi:hypothetical protein
MSNVKVYNQEVKSWFVNSIKYSFYSVVCMHREIQEAYEINCKEEIPGI